MLSSATRMVPWIERWSPGHGFSRLIFSKDLFVSSLERSITTSLLSTRPSNSLHEQDEEDTRQWRSKIRHCFESGDVGRAGIYFHDMPYRDAATWNTMIRGYARNQTMETAERFFEAMPQRNLLSWAVLLEGYVIYGRLGDARKLFDRMPKRNISCWNFMIAGYMDDGRVELARELFDVMPERNTATWAIIIAGCLRQKLEKEAQDLLAQAPMLETGDYMRAGKLVDLVRHSFDEMLEKNVVPLNAIMKGYVVNGEVYAARRMFDNMPDRNMDSWNTMLHGYVKHGMMGQAVKLFEEMPRRNNISWNTLISGYRDKEALVQFCRMVREGFKTVAATLVSVISVSASLSAVGWGRTLHSHAIRTGYEHDKKVMNSLIRMYSKCGLAMDACKLFNLMVHVGLQPDHLSFSSLMSACAHRGLIDEEWK